MNEAELRALCVELYIAHGDREFSIDNYDIDGYTIDAGYTDWVKPKIFLCALVKLTPKAIELVKT